MDFRLYQGRSCRTAEAPRRFGSDDYDAAERADLDGTFGKQLGRYGYRIWLVVWNIFYFPIYWE